LPSPPEPAADDARKRERIALAACMFLTTACIGFVQPFLPPYLKASGLSDGQIGFVVGLGTGASLVVQPVLGRLSDRWDARRPLMTAAALLGGLAYFAFRFVPAALGPLAATAVFGLLVALGTNAITYLSAAGGVLVGRLVGSARGGAAYAGYRIWGSIGFIVTALVTGLLLGQQTSVAGRDGLAGVFLWGPLLFLANAVVALFVPDKKRASALAAPAPVPASVAAGAGAAGLHPFLLAFFLYQFAMGGMLAFLSLHLKALGAGQGFISFAWATGVVFEALMMARIGRWSDKWGRRPALAVAFLALPVRLLLYAVAPNPWFMLAAQTLEAINFGIIGPVSIAFVNDLATDKNRGWLQARLAGVSGLAFALGPVTGGLVAGAAGYRIAFVVLAGVAIAGAILFLRRVAESHPAAQPLGARGCAAGLRPLLRLLAAPPSG